MRDYMESLRQLIIDRLNLANSIVGEPTDGLVELSDADLLDKYANQIATYAFDLGQYNCVTKYDN